MKLLIFFLTLSILSLINCDKFDDFVKRRGKIYSSKNEKKFRRLIYSKNFKMIEKHNLEFAKGLQTFKMSENKFSDMTQKEIVDKFTGRKPIKRYKVLATRQTQEYKKKDDLPLSLDWRRSGIVSQVKDQGTCGSCWAFSVSGAIESQYAKNYGKLYSLSEQQLVDCSFNSFSGNWGCDGGLDEIAYDYVQSFGIMNSSDYPAVWSIGPISVSININEAFYYYSGGIYNVRKCKTDLNSLNHALLLVGYGKDSLTGLDFWILKNSWGTSWGERGYIRIRRNFNNMCGIATDALIPLIYNSKD